MPNIEVERKFVLHGVPVDSIVSGLTPIWERLIVDMYFDYPDMRLTCADVWLRERDGIPEVKISAGVFGRASGTDMYREVRYCENVLRAIGIHFNGRDNFQGHLRRAGIGLFAAIETRRRKYSHQDFIIDIDTAIYEDGSEYGILEIELMVDETEKESAEKRILRFADSLGLRAREDEYVRGKLVEYIRRYRSDHYRLLLSAGVVK